MPAANKGVDNLWRTSDDEAMRAGIVLPGVTQVTCPVCRSAPGRPCANRRGYLLEGTGSHRQRRAAWLAAERAEAPTSR